MLYDKPYILTCVHLFYWRLSKRKNQSILMLQVLSVQYRSITLIGNDQYYTKYFITEIEAFTKSVISIIFLKNIMYISKLNT